MSFTKINYRLSDAKNSYSVKISLFNSMGQFVRILRQANEPPGQHSVVWNGLDASGSLVPSGIYFYQIKIDGFTLTKKLLFLK